MIKGTVTNPVNVYTASYKLAMQARAGDKVIASSINNGVWEITQLTRNGRVMLDGIHYVVAEFIHNDSPPEEPPPPPPTTGTRAYLYRNHELAAMGRPDVEWWANHPPIPDTRNIFGSHPRNNGRVIYTRRLQYFLYTNLQNRVPEMSIDEFNKQFKYWCNDKLAFFNGAGSGSRRVWPLGLNLKSKDMEGNQLVYGGATLTLLSHKPEFINRELKYPIACIDAFDDEIEKYNSFDYPHLWCRPSITFGPDAVKSEPFDRFKARGRMPIMLNGTNVAWIAHDKVRILRDDEPTPPQFTKDWGS